MDTSSTSDAQQLSAYGLDCLVDFLRIVIALTPTVIYLVPIVAAVLAVFWWTKVRGKNRISGIAVIAAATIFICLSRSSLTGILQDRLALLRKAQGEGYSHPEAPKAVQHR